MLRDDSTAAKQAGLGEVAQAGCRISETRLSREFHDQCITIEGFTLLEVLIVIAIMLIIVAIALPRITPLLQAAHKTTIVAKLRILTNELTAYRMDCDGYPANLDALKPSSQKACPQTSAALPDPAAVSGLPAVADYRISYAATVGDENGHYEGYALAAVPSNSGSSGNESYFADQTGIIRAHRNGPATVSGPVLVNSNLVRTDRYSQPSAHFRRFAQQPIDATADPAVFLRLAAVARANRRPLCWGEVFAGGFGGLIARARPEKDPHPTSVRSAILSYCRTLPQAPFREADGYDNKDHQPVMAYDDDVAQIASALARLVLDTALQREPSDFPYAVYLIGMRKEWIFEQPFDTRPINVIGEGWEVEDTDAGRGTDRAEVEKVLLAMACTTNAEPDPSG